MNEHARPQGLNGDCDGNAAPYVLGALPPAEHEAFVAHLETCAICREEVASLQSVAAALPLAAPQVLAPPGLKARLMAEVRGADTPREPEPEPRPAPVRARRRLLALPSFAPLAVAVAAVIALLVVVLAEGGGGVKTRTYRAAVHPPGASGVVTVSGAHAQLTLTGMPATERGRIYELWIKRAGAPAPTDALFTVTRAGRASVGVPGSAKGVTALLVTSEPLGGSRTPTRTPAIIAAIG
jgi:anti-sigma-K factor RskA